MPQANGTARPLGLPALEATRAPLACATRLTAIEEPDWLAGRDGSRAGRGALEAVRDRTLDRQDGRYGSLGEADLPGVFAHMAHPWLVARWRLRLDDRAVLPLLRPWRKARIVDTDGPGVPLETGTPHGGPVSPVLANGSRP
jgi:hypothetical protein